MISIASPVARAVAGAFKTIGQQIIFQSARVAAHYKSGILSENALTISLNKSFLTARKISERNTFFLLFSRFDTLSELSGPGVRTFQGKAPGSSQPPAAHYAIRMGRASSKAG